MNEKLTPQALRGMVGDLEQQNAKANVGMPNAFWPMLRQILYALIDRIEQLENDKKSDPPPSP